MDKLSVTLCRTLLRRELGLKGCRAVFMADDKRTAHAYMGQRVKVRFRLLTATGRSRVSMMLLPEGVPECQAHSSATPNLMMILYDAETLEPLD